MDDQILAQAQNRSMSLLEKGKYFGGAALAAGIPLEVFGGGMAGLLIAGIAGGGAAFFSEEIRDNIIDRFAGRHGINRDDRLHWLLTGEQEEARNTDELESLHASVEEDMFTYEQKEQALPFRRATIQELIAHIPFNSYRVYLGRSVTIEGNPARSVNILKQHLKLIGASQKGKSSMAAAILTQMIATHDIDHLLVSILDLEDRTGNLFADDSHIVTFYMGDKQPVKMHARSKEQVLEYLGYIVQLMNYRYTLSVTEVAKMPLLVVYVEEFLALKDYFKRRMAWSKDKEQAQEDYETLVYGISELARRGLKARIQLLLCAQVDYRDDDLYEALANITAGMSFCVKPSAAQAAGFTDAEMLKKNHKDNIIGQAVAEFSGCKDMILAPDYPLEQRLIAWEKENGKDLKPAPPAFVVDQDEDLDDEEGEIEALQKKLIAGEKKQDEEPTLTPRELKAIEAWNNGAKSGRKLAAALEISENRGNKLMNNLLLRGLVTRDEEE